MPFTPKTITRNGQSVAQIGLETGLETTNEYVKVFDCFYAAWDECLIAATNTGDDTITAKITAQVHKDGVEKTLIEKDIASGATEVLQRASASAYSKFNLYVKSKVDDTPGEIKAEFCMK